MNINTRKAHNSLDVNALFDKFFDTFSCTLDKLAPLKKASRKQKKLLQKPWIAKAILNSIKKKSNLYEQHLKR